MHMGFSLSDIRHMSMSDFIAYTDLYISDRDSKNKSPLDDYRQATQSDIDAFFM